MATAYASSGKEKEDTDSVLAPLLGVVCADKDEESQCGDALRKMKKEAPGASGLFFQIIGFWNPKPHLKTMMFRRSSGRDGGSFEQLDGIRSLALMWVSAFHIYTCSVLGPWKTFEGEIQHSILAVMEQGQCGVTMFFVLSGFLISHIFHAIRRKGDLSLLKAWKLFIYRRFWRIWPSLVVSVALVQMYASNQKGYGIFTACGTGQFWEVMWRNMIFVWNLKPWGLEPGCALSPEVEWSVSTEFQLYLFTPLFIEAYIRKKSLGWTLCIIAMLASIYSRCWMVSTYDLWEEKTAFLRSWVTDQDHEQNILYFSSWTRANEYMVGIMTHFIWKEFSAYRESDVKNYTTTLWLALTSIPGQIFVWGTFSVVQVWLLWNHFFWNGHYTKFLETSYMIFNFFLFSMFAAYAIIATVAMPRAQHTFINKFISKVLSSSWLYPVASVSYTAYLMQYIAWWCFTWPTVTNIWEFALYESIMFLMSMVIGLALSLTIERPFMKIGRLIEPYVFPKDV